MATRNRRHRAHRMRPQGQVVFATPRNDRGSLLGLVPLMLILSLAGHTIDTSEVAVMHYGHFGGLSLTCKRDELILMDSEVLGYSTNRGCAPQPLCSVPYTLAKWYCRGKSTCGGMQVERRPLHKRTCGSEFTNCLRVEYQCVPTSKLTDVCTDTVYEAAAGYISSPSFPEMYPPDRNCTCVLSAPSGGHVQIDTAFFLLKSTRPCRDWLRVTVDDADGDGRGGVRGANGASGGGGGGDPAARCGYVPEQRRFIGRHVNLNFVSDSHGTEMGFWLRFSGTSGDAVKIRCGRYVNTDDSVTPFPKTLRPPTSGRYRRSSMKPFTTTPATTTTQAEGASPDISAPSYEPISGETESTNSRLNGTRPAKVAATVRKTTRPDTRHYTASNTRGKLSSRKSTTAFYGGNKFPGVSTAAEPPSPTAVTPDERLTSPDPPLTSTYWPAIAITQRTGLSLDDELLTTDANRVLVKDKSTDTTEDDDIPNVYPPNDETEMSAPVETRNGDPLAGQESSSEVGKQSGQNLNEDKEVGFPSSSRASVIGTGYEEISNDLRHNAVVELNYEQDEQEKKEEENNMIEVNFIDYESYTEAVPPFEEYTKRVPSTIFNTDEKMRLLKNSDFDRISEGKSFWTSSEYVDLDADYDKEYLVGEDALTPIVMTTPPAAIPTRTSSQAPLPEMPMAAATTATTVSMTKTTARAKTTATTTTDEPLIHFVHAEVTTNEPSREVGGATVTNRPLKPLDLMDSGIEEALPEPAEGTTLLDILSPSLDDMATETDVAVKGQWEGRAGPLSERHEESHVLPGDRVAPTQSGEHVTRQGKRNDFKDTPMDNDISEKHTTDHRLFSPSEGSNSRLGPLDNRIPAAPIGEEAWVEERDFSLETDMERDYQLHPTGIHDWRLTLSRAGFSYSEITTDRMKASSTPDELLHYVYSGRPAGTRPSIATGEFQPGGDIISLIDEQDLTTTPMTTAKSTTTTTTQPPEIVTLFGRLAPDRPINTLGQKPAVLLPARRLTRPHPVSTRRPPTDMRTMIVAPPDMVWEYGETPWRNLGLNTSWIPPPPETTNELAPWDEQPQDKVSLTNPAAVKAKTANKDLMWVLIVIAIVLWVVFVALLALLIYHRRRRLACFRGQTTTHREMQDVPISKDKWSPSLSAPLTPGIRPHHSSPEHSHMATQTGRSRLRSGPRNESSAGRMRTNSVLSWGSVASLQRELAERSLSDWSLPSAHLNVSVGRALSPSPCERADSTQTLVSSGGHQLMSSSAQTDVSGTLSKRFRRSAIKTRPSSGVASPDQVSLGSVSFDPVVYTDSRMGTCERGASSSDRQVAGSSLPRAEVVDEQHRRDGDPKRSLRHVPPARHVHTILRNTPGSTRQPDARPQVGLSNSNERRASVSSVGRVSLPPPGSGVQMRPKQRLASRSGRRCSDISLPPPPLPPDCFTVPLPTAPASGAAETQDKSYTTIRPRHRPRAGSISAQLQSEVDNWRSSLASLYTANDVSSSAETGSEPAGDQLPDSTVVCHDDVANSQGREMVDDSTAPPELLRQPPLLSFPPPPPPSPLNPPHPPTPPTPPPLPERRLSVQSDRQQARKSNKSEDPDDLQETPPGREDLAGDGQLTLTLARVKSSPNVSGPHQLEEGADNGELRRGESAPDMNKDSCPEEKLKGLVPQQAFFFNDKVQPELRRILSKRRFSHLAVEV